MQLKLAGKLQGVRGFVSARCSTAARPGRRRTFRSCLEPVAGFQVPIWYGLHSGHTSTGCLTLPFGVEVRLDAGQRWLQLEEAAVAEG